MAVEPVRYNEERDIMFVLLLAFLLLLQVVLSMRAKFCLVGYFIKRFKACLAVPGTTPAIGWYTKWRST